MRFTLKVLVLLLLPTIALGQTNQNKFQPLLNAAKKSNSDAVILLKDGEKVLDYNKNAEREKIFSRSVTKSIVALAVAKLLTDGKLDSLDTPVNHFYPEWKQGLKKNITIRHLMNHTSGLQNIDSPRAEIYPSPNAIQLALCASVVDTPGTKQSYNNKATNLLSGIVEKASGQKLDNYLDSTIFQSIGISDFDWQTDDAGNPYGMSGFKVYPSDLAQLGQLVLQKGSWNGNQLISEQWIDKILAQGHSKSLTIGHLWWRIPKNKKYVIDDNIIETLQKGGLSDKMLAYAKNMKGTYESKGAVEQAIMNEFEDRKEFFKFRKAIVSQGLPIWNKSLSGPIIGYKAEGSAGEFLVIYPELNIVAVRMIEPENMENYNPKTDGFGTFGDLVYKLASK